MKKIFHIAFIDIKIMLRDKSYLFWSLVFPMIFIFIFGNLFEGDSGPTKAQLHVLNQDKGQWGSYLVEKIKSPSIQLIEVEKEPKNYSRMLILPPDFSGKIASKKAQELIFKKRESANVKAAAQVEIKITQGITRLITEMILHPDTETFLKEHNVFRDIVTVKAGFPENTIDKVPTGFDHVIPGVIVQFILMMVLIYGGITVMMDRQRGVLTRIMFSSASIAHLWGGKFTGRLIMGLIQALILIITGKLFFGLNLGNTFLSALVIVFLSFAVASLSIFIGSLINKEDLIVGLAVLLSNMFAALGGCWWPIEVVPDSVRAVGMISPAYWAMDAFHQVIFFRKDFLDILPNLLVLFLFASVFTVLAIKYFKLKK